MSDEREHVELRRFHDATEAEITRSFLCDHGVRATVRDHRGGTSALDRIAAGPDLRLVVPAAQLAEALAALEAMGAPAELSHGDAADGTGEEYGRGPYRAARVSADAAMQPYAPRQRHLGFILGVLVPIGGGHFYARHEPAGLVFGGAIVGSFLGATLGGAPWLFVAAMLCVLADATGAVSAVTRFQSGRVPSGGRQVAFAAITSTLCVLAAYATRGATRGAHERGAYVHSPTPLRPW